MTTSHRNRPDQAWLAALETLHRAITNENAYIDFLDQVQKLIRARFLIMGMFDPFDPERHAHRFAAPSAIGLNNAVEFLACAATSHEDGSFAIRDAVPQSVLLDFEVYDDRLALEKRPTMALLERKYDAHHIGAVNAQKNRAWVDYFMFAHNRADYKDPEFVRRNVQFFVPHIGVASEVRRAFRLLEQRYNAIFAALNHLGYGVALIAANREVIVRNDLFSAYAELGDALKISAAGQPYAVLSECDIPFQSALGDILDSAAGVADHDHRTLILRRRDRKREPYIVDLVPLREQVNGELNADLEAALLFMIDPEERSHIAHDGLSKAFSLTTAESHVCRAMLDGLTNQDIADAKNVSLPTVKTQMSAIFAKTGTANRAALTRLAMKISPPLRTPKE